MSDRVSVKAVLRHFLDEVPDEVLPIAPQCAFEAGMRRVLNALRYRIEDVARNTITDEEGRVFVVHEYADHSELAAVLRSKNV